MYDSPLGLEGTRDLICPSLIRATLCQRDGRDSDPSPQERRWVQCGTSRAQHSFVILDIQAHSGSNSISYMGMSSVSLTLDISEASHLERSVLAPWRGIAQETQTALSLLIQTKVCSYVLMCTALMDSLM